MRLPATLALVFLGGTLGGGARIALDVAIEAGPVPWDVVAINVVGSALLGFVVARAEQTTIPWWLPGVGPGLLGGFTTFSAIAALPAETGVSGITGALVLAGTMALSVAAAAAGWAAGSTEASRELAANAAEDAQ